MNKDYFKISVDNKNKLYQLASNDPEIKNSKAFKYINYYHVYLSEKSFLIELADLPSNSKCLDISTGIGFLPWLLKVNGHSCDATDIENWGLDLDSHKGNQIAFKKIREFLEVHIKPLHIVKEQPISFDTKYDCIFSTRIVFDHNWRADSYKYFVNNMLEYTDKLVLKWNFELDDTPEILKPYKSQYQFENGTITIHTDVI